MTVKWRGNKQRGPEIKRLIRILAFGAGLFAAACQTALSPVPPVTLAEGLVARTGDTPPAEPAGACWAADTSPAVIETVTEQVLVEPERRATDGSLISAAIFSIETQQRIVQDRRDIWFATPCPDALTVDFIATLQRALKARGLYLAPVTGEMDAVTRVAVRRYQEPLGLDSDTISLTAARQLGVVAGDFAPQ